MGYTVLEIKSEKFGINDKTTRKVAYVQCDCGKIDRRRLDHIVSGRTKQCKSCSSKLTAQHHPPPSPVYKGVHGFSKTHFNSIKRGAKVRGIQFDVSIQDLWNLWVQQNGRCALTGIELTLEAPLKNQTVDWNTITASPDRIDSSKGYILGNIQWVHKTVNAMKNNSNLEDFISWCQLVSDHVNHEPSSVNSLSN